MRVLAKEFSDYRDEISALWRYAEVVTDIIRTPLGQPTQPWPQRPPLRGSERDSVP